MSAEQGPTSQPQPTYCMTWKDFFLRLSPLGVSLIFGIYGVFILNSESENNVRDGAEEGLTIVMLTTSLILLGAWLATELWYIHDRDRGK